MKDVEGIDRAHRILEPYWQQIQDDFNEQNRRFLALAAANHECDWKSASWAPSDRIIYG